MAKSILTDKTQRLTGATGTTSTRELRALALYRNHADEIERIAGDLYLVPSCTGEGFYRVDYERETCNCPDSRRHPQLNCKHVMCVRILRAKRRRSEGPKPKPAPVPVHIQILDDAREHPERTYSEHVAAAESIAAKEYRRDLTRT